MQRKRGLFYVGVSRYLRRRWLGGDDLEPRDSHSRKWRSMHMLGTYAAEIGKAEDFLITRLRSSSGEQACANIRGERGDTSAFKPSLLYICVGRTLDVGL